MKRIKFNQPRYVIPIIVIPFLFFLFYALHNEEEVIIEKKKDFNSEIQDVSEMEKKKKIEGRLEAYQKRFASNANDISAIASINDENNNKEEFDNLYTNRERYLLDSLNTERNLFADEMEDEDNYEGYLPKNRLKENINEDQQNLERLIDKINEGNKSDTNDVENNIEYDPTKIMREQYRMLDSLEKANNPEYIQKQEMLENEIKRKEMLEWEKKASLGVTKLKNDKRFNTVMRKKESEFIKAIVDQNVKGYAGSRVRIRLLEGIKVGNYIIKEGSYLYANINGFGAERVFLEITSIMYNDEILPIQLSIYDMDGMKGLFVPESKFRAFSKDLGSESMQGVDLSTMTGDMKEQLFTSLIQRMFTSTSNAVSNLIRSNKVKIKYSTFIYLIDEKILQEKREKIYQQNQN